MPAEASEHVGLIIDDNEFRYWDDFEFRRTIDSFDTVTFVAPFEPERAEFRETFRPFSFQSMVVTVRDELLSSGKIVGIHPKVTSERRTVDVTGYALPAVLQDCTEPASALPLEFNKLGLRAIAETLCRPFGLGLEFLADEGAKFDKTALDIDAKGFDFLAELAKQRNLVLSNNAFGDLLCWQSIEPGKPVARLSDSESPVSIVEAAFSPQEYFSEITGIAPAKRGRVGSTYTEKNPYLPSPLRPRAFRLDDTEKADAPEATRAKLGRMFAQAATFTVSDLPTWRDPQGDLWAPNKTILLHAPSAMVYTEYEFLIRAVTLKQTAERLSASLELVFPGAFSGQIPQGGLPWDG
jgi:prophage tail gpP-like protein